MNKKKKGFTLVELLVVIAILAILATVTVIGYSSFTEKANKSVDEQLCAQYNNLIEAENVERPNLNLKEISLLIELNGIRSNQLETKSKNYEFAFDKENQKLVLLDVSSGEVMFPAGYNQSATLWSVLREDLRLPKGINHAEMLHSFETDAQFEAPEERVVNNGPKARKRAITANDIVIEMNNCTLSLKNKNALAKVTGEIKLTKGVIVADVAPEQVEKIKPLEPEKAEEIVVIDRSEESKAPWGKVYADEEITYAQDKMNCSITNPALADNLFEVADGNYTLKNKYFSAFRKSELLYSPAFRISNANVTTALNSGKTLTFENCTFENLSLALSEIKNGKIIFKNCNFFNCLNWSLNISASNKDLVAFSYEITGCHFVNCGGGMNISLPVGGLSKIEDNNFDLMNDKLILKYESSLEPAKFQYLKQKFLEKNNAIQFTYEDPSVEIGQVVVNRNRVTRGTSLVILHTTLVGKEAKDGGATVYEEGVFTAMKNVFNTKITGTDNSLHEGVLNKIFADPDGREGALGSAEMYNRLKELVQILGKKIN